MIKKVFIFITALAMFIIASSALEFLVPLVLGINGFSEEAMSNPEAMKSFMERQPAAYFIGLIFVHAIAAVIGGLVSGLGALPKWSTYLLAGGLMALGYLLAHTGSPTWYLVLDLTVYIPGVLLGYEWVSSTRKLVAKKAQGKH